MKFKFCGELDCPDWVLAEIAVLSKVSSVKLKLICTQVVKLFSEGKFDYEKVLKLLSDAHLDNAEDIQGIMVALRFIIKGGVSFQIPNDEFVSELQQLGLPKEHSVVVGKVALANYNEILKCCRASSLRLNRIDSCIVQPDFYLESGSDNNKVICCDKVSIDLKVSTKRTNDGEAGTTTDQLLFTVDKESLSVLIYELNIAREIMDKLNPPPQNEPQSET